MPSSRASGAQNPRHQRVFTSSVWSSPRRWDRASASTPTASSISSKKLPDKPDPATQLSYFAVQPDFSYLAMTLADSLDPLILRQVRIAAASQPPKLLAVLEHSRVTIPSRLCWEYSPPRNSCA